MLSPRELAQGQSFNDDYELKVGADGQLTTKTEQVKGIGNSVCLIVAEQLAFVNLAIQQPAN